MSIGTLIFGAIILTLLGLFVYFMRKKMKVVVIIIFSIILVFGIGIRLVDKLFYSASFEDYFTDISLVNVNTNDTLSISEVGGKKVLYNVSNDEIVSFEDMTFEIYQFVYLRKVDSFYVVVLSKDTDADYSDGRFFQADYEWYSDFDRIAFIDMNHSMMFSLREYELINRSIDLNSMMSCENGIGFKAYHYYSDFTFAYFVSIFAYSELDSVMITSSPTLNADAFFYPMINVHEVENAIHDNVTNFVIGDGVYVVFQTDTEVVAMKSDISLTVSDGVIHGYGAGFSRIDVEDWTYFQQGYYLAYLHEIYYVDNNMKLKKLGETLPICDIEDLQHWTDYIPLS